MWFERPYTLIQFFVYNTAYRFYFVTQQNICGNIKVNGASYAGGFAGGLANSSTVNCSATAGESLAVHATGMNAGGFAGIATLGWAANLGKTDSKDSDLLGSVVSLVEGLLSQNPGEVSSLLSLAGVNPSYILGCTINAPLTVTGTDFVGGITGRGDGVTIAPSNAENLGKICNYHQHPSPHAAGYRQYGRLAVCGSWCRDSAACAFCTTQAQGQKGGALSKEVWTNATNHV